MFLLKIERQSGAGLRPTNYSQRPTSNYGQRPPMVNVPSSYTVSCNTCHQGIMEAQSTPRAGLRAGIAGRGEQDKDSLQKKNRHTSPPPTFRSE